MTNVMLNMTVQITYGIAPTLYGLQKDATTVAKYAGDAAGGVEFTRFSQNAIYGFWLGVDSAAGVE
jgi:hypothetical protein